MTFVYPLLLGGLVLAGLPVLLHLLIRKKPKSLVFPAYRFLVEKKRSNTRNLRLRHLLLLLLRMLLIALVCFALSRPRLFHEAFGISKERPIALALVFDTTPSMEYRSNDQARLDLAKRRCLELLDQLPESTRVLVLETADPVSNARAEWYPSLEQARQHVQRLTLRPESAPVNSALDEAIRRLKNTEDVELQRLPKVACVFSDRTRPSWQPASSGVRPDDVQILYFDVGIDEPADIGIVSAEIQSGRQAFRQGEIVPITAVVSATAKGSNHLQVAVTGKTIEQPINVDADKEQTLALEIDTADLKAGFHHAVVALKTSTDALPHNNRRFVTFRILDKPRVLVLADDLKKSHRFAFALQALNYAVDLKLVADKVDTAAYEAIFLVGVAAPNEKLWGDLASYAKSGRGICVVPPGEGLVRAAYNSDPAKAVLPGRIVNDVKADAAWSLLNIDQGHPFLAPFRDWILHGYDVVEDPARARRYWKVEASDKNVVVRYDDAHRDPAIVEWRADKQSGPVVLLTTPMDASGKDWNNYDEKIKNFYLALTMLCARHLVAEPEGVTLNYTFGKQPPMVRRPAERAFTQFTLSSGDTSEEIRFDDRGVWLGEKLTKPGNYTVEGSNPATSQTEAVAKFSINIAADESDLRRVSVSEIESVLGQGAVVPQDRRGSIVDTLQWDEPVELFPWLMIALLFLLAIENLLANRFYRQPEPPTAA